MRIRSRRRRCGSSRWRRRSRLYLRTTALLPWWDELSTFDMTERSNGLPTAWEYRSMENDGDIKRTSDNSRYRDATNKGRYHLSIRHTAFSDDARCRSGVPVGRLLPASVPAASAIRNTARRSNLAAICDANTVCSRGDDHISCAAISQGRAVVCGALGSFTARQRLWPATGPVWFGY